METEYFKSQIDAAKFAMAIAIKNQIEPNEFSGTSTIWNQGSFDPNGEIRELIRVLFPETETPYRLVEFYINTGLNIVDSLMKGNDLPLEQIL